MFEWLKRLLKRKRQVEKPISIGEHVELDRQIEELKKRQREEFARRVRPKTPLEALEEANIRKRRRQPASQTYTEPHSARNKRMWRLQVSQEELDEL